MLIEKKDALYRIYVPAALIFLLTAWFSVGYNHFDEHFQVIEFAGLKLGLTEKDNLPWEYNCMMRPAIQPMIVYSIYKTAAAAGITNPFMVAFIIRLISAILTFFCIHLVIRLYVRDFTNRTLLYSFLLLSYFLWFVPYNAARFSSETFAGRIFLIGIAWFFLRKNTIPVHYLVLGLLLGLSFITRYQVAFMIIGFAAWLVVIRRPGTANLVLFATGIVVATLLGIVADRWFYDEWVLTAWNYFRQNMILGKAAEFGVSPWWYYIEQTFMNAFPPLSIVYILAVFMYFWFFPKDMITWTFVPFLAAHFLIPHKEIRFLFPIIGFLPVMIIRTADKMLQIRGYGLLHKPMVKNSVKIFWLLNFIMLAVLVFRPADDQIALYRTIWNQYTTPAKLYFTDENPYHRAKVDVNYYKRKSLVFQKVDSLDKILPSKDSISLAVVKTPLSLAGENFTPVLVYASFPQWVRRFNFNHWMDRTSFWYVYELHPVSKRNQTP